MKAFVLFFLLCSPAFAVDDMQVLLERCQSSLEGKPQWEWSVVRVRAILEMGIKVPVLASFSVNPEVELFFVKK